MLPAEPGLIAFDLDGTALDLSGRITPRTVEALRAAAAMGWTLAIATGRPTVMVTAVVEALGPSLTHGVMTNGSIVCTFPSGDVLHSVLFDVAAATTVVHRIRAADARFGFAMATDAGFGFEDGFNEKMPVSSGGTPIPDVLAIGGSTVIKLFVFHPVYGGHWMLEHLPEIAGDELEVSHMGAEAVELGPRGVSKATGLEWLCEHLGLESSAVIAFGDNLNDTEMLRWAGHGVAMSNSDPATLAVADEVVASNADDGVAHFIERFLLGL